MKMPDSSVTDSTNFVRKVISRSEIRGPRGGRWERLKLACGHEINRPTKRLYPATEAYCPECRFPCTEPTWTSAPVWLEGSDGELGATIGGNKVLIRSRSRSYDVDVNGNTIGSGLLDIEAAKAASYRFINMLGPKLRI